MGPHSPSSLCKTANPTVGHGNPPWLLTPWVLWCWGFAGRREGVK